ncbi:MAG: peptidyl-prolyl cis-trans isomerase [Verrucomicrobiota bacterium]|jgi:peptidyl-prolyl cis-trans isomerase D
MITVFRKHQKWLMIVIAILSIPFVFYFVQKPDYGAMRGGSVGRIYDRNVSQVEYARNKRLFELAKEMGMINFLHDLVPAAQLQDLIPGGTTREEIFREFTWDLLILQHEAAGFGIKPTAPEIANVVKSFRAFQGPNGFDINRYNQFTEIALASKGFTDAQIEELAADQLFVDRVKDLLGVGVHLSEAESRENYERLYAKLDSLVVRLRSEDYAKDVNVSDMEIATYYKTHAAELKSEEKRKIDFVTFGLSDDQKKLTGKERVDALQKLADRANDFEQALLEKGAEFHQVAAKFQLSIQSTGEFTAAAPDPKLSTPPELPGFAFQLTAQEPNSEPVQVADGFYVLHLSGVAEARPLTLEEAKPKILAALRQQRLQERVAMKGVQAAHQIREETRMGIPLEVAIKNTTLKAEPVPPFSLEESAPAEKDKNFPDLEVIKNALGEMSPGEVSEFVPTPQGGVFVILQKREPVDDAAFAKGKADFEERFSRMKREIVFLEWLQGRRRAAGVQLAAS